LSICIARVTQFTPNAIAMVAITLLIGAWIEVLGWVTQGKV